MLKGRIYDWTGLTMRHLERGVLYHAFYFDPASGRRFELGRVVNPGEESKPFKGPPQPPLFVDHFESADGAAWRDYGAPSRRQEGKLVGTKGMVTILETVRETNLMASVEANTDAEAGVILRFHDPDHYLVALYSPLLKALYLHDRKNGVWGDQLGRVPVPEIGPRVHLTAAADGKYAAVELTDGEHTYYTPIVKVDNTAAGRAGVWLFQIGDRQEYRSFELSRGRLIAPKPAPEGPARAMAWYGEYQAPNVPSPQDWVLVLEQIEP